MQGELTSHYWPAAEGQNQVAAKVTLVVLVCKGQPVRKAQSWPACLIKWCIVILPRRDNKRGSALPPPHNGSGGGGHRRAYSGRGQRPAPVVTVARVYLQPPPLSAHCAN